MTPTLENIIDAYWEAWESLGTRNWKYATICDVAQKDYSSRFVLADPAGGRHIEMDTVVLWYSLIFGGRDEEWYMGDE